MLNGKDRQLDESRQEYEKQSSLSMHELEKKEMKPSNSPLGNSSPSEVGNPLFDDGHGVTL